MPISPSPDRRAAAQAARQHGALSSLQAEACGLSETQIRQRARTGQWRRAVHGVYVLAGAPDTWRQRAWVAFLATQAGGGVVSHETAAAVFGLLVPPSLPHVTVPVTGSVRSAAAVVHRSRVDRIDTQWRDGLRVTKPSRVVVDLAASIDRPSLEALVDDSFCRRLAAPASVLAALDRTGRGRAGREVLRAVLEVWTEAIAPGSVAEVRMLRQLAELGLTGVVTQHTVFDAGGGFVARLDAAVPALRKGLEYDGVRHHNPRHWARDEPRYRRLRDLGWEVPSVSTLDLMPGADRLRDLVERWLRAPAA